jgi:hypothetical protein
MDIYRILEKLAVISNKQTLTEGQMKRSLEARAEKMSKADFVANAGEYGMSAEEAAEFWAAVNGEEEVDEAYEKLPKDQLGLDKFSQAALSGGQRKRDALANPKQTVALAKTSARNRGGVAEGSPPGGFKPGDKIKVDGQKGPTGSNVGTFVQQLLTTAGQKPFYAFRFDDKKYPEGTYDTVSANHIYPADGVAESKGSKPDFLDLDRDGDKKEPMKKAAREKTDHKSAFQSQFGGSAQDLTKGLSVKPKTVGEAKKAKPDFLDVDKDGDKKEPMKKAAKQAKLDEMFPGTPEYELRFGKDDASSAFDKKKISTGTVYSRKHHEEPESDDDAPRAAGRPKGSKRRLGAKGPGVDSKLLKGKGGLKEQDINPADHGEYDREGDMALNQLHQIADAAEELHSILDANENLPEWVQSKITKAVDYLDTARDYMKAKGEQYTDRGEEPVAEKAPPGAKAERMVKHIKSGYAKDGKLSDKEKSIAYATAWKAKKAGKVEEESTDTRDNRAERAGKRVAKDIEYDEKKKDGIHGQRRGAEDSKAEKAGKKVAKDIEHDEKVDETTVAGSVATGGEAPKSKGGMQFGKGVYEGAIAESFEKKLGSILNEGMNLTVSTDDQGQRNISVSATGADADVLGDMLKMAGLFSSEGYSRTCESCHGIHEAGACQAEQVEEELANSPDEQYSDADTMLNTLSGGLNGPKLQVNPNNMGDNPLAMRNLGKGPSGQVNLGDIAEGIEKESTTRLWDLYKGYKAK